MSAKTIYDPTRYLAEDTLGSIRALGITLDNYTANIDSRLRARGECALADRMLAEIEEGLAYARQKAAAKRGY